MPAASPTLSPTLSAMVAGFRGSSSGMLASTLPTRSAPMSAALVKMPPPILMNRAIRLAPIPTPAIVIGSGKAMYRPRDHQQGHGRNGQPDGGPAPEGHREGLAQSLAAEVGGPDGGLDGYLQGYQPGHRREGGAHRKGDPVCIVEEGAYHHRQPYGHRDDHLHLPPQEGGRAHPDRL